MNANGKECTSEEAVKNVNDLDTSTDVQILGDSPIVLSLELREECETRTCGNAMNEPYHVKTIECRSENHVPKVVLGVLHLEGDQRAAVDKE